MTERERLHELIVDAENKFFAETPCGTDSSRIEKVVEHLLANGVILPPCKVGDKLYFLYGTDTPQPWVCSFTESVCKIGVKVRNFLNGYSVYAPDDFGKTVFLSREEAEAALKKLQKEGNTT